MPAQGPRRYRYERIADNSGISDERLDGIGAEGGDIVNVAWGRDAKQKPIIVALLAKYPLRQERKPSQLIDDEEEGPW